ncbi:PadR family transcriptional regulator [Paenibacillus sp. NPDC058071]|uniref:PadR family transcriptional regulator n=1 Tax=Paenibacillus sp. NPDC058071 TaxID=3346326 RepID=UPI0036DB0AE8
MSLQVFILGMLSQGDHHPYDIKKTVQRSLENTINITDGTLYYHFDSLLKKGLIRKVDVVQIDNRPEKTTYGITEPGLKALEEEVYASFKNFNNNASIYSSLLFLDNVNKTKLAFIIEETIERLEGWERKGADYQLDKGKMTESQAESVQILFQHAAQTLSNNLTLLRSVLSKIRQDNHQQ